MSLFQSLTNSDTAEQCCVFCAYADTPCTDVPLTGSPVARDIT